VTPPLREAAADIVRLLASVASDDSKTSSTTADDGAMIQSLINSLPAQYRPVPTMTRVVNSRVRHVALDDIANDDNEDNDDIENDDDNDDDDDNNDGDENVAAVNINVALATTMGRRGVAWRLDDVRQPRKRRAVSIVDRKASLDVGRLVDALRRHSPSQPSAGMYRCRVYELPPARLLWPTFAQQQNS
jgi:predicted protein tyrosine phosphatase